MIECTASSRKMNIMFDLHGVSETMPDLIKPMMKTFRHDGHKIIICSGPTMNRIIEELEALRYVLGHHYDQVISVVDYLQDVKGVTFEFDEKGRPWTDDETWFRSKGWIAADYNVDIVIDDTPQYKDNMPSNVMFWLMR